MQRRFIGFVVCVVTVFLLCGACKRDFDQRMLQETQDYSLKHCPKLLEAGHRLDSMTYDPELRILHEWHTLFGPQDTPEMRAFWQQHVEEVRQLNQSVLKEDAKWQTCKEQYVKFSYHYRSAGTGKEVMCVVLIPGVDF